MASKRHVRRKECGSKTRYQNYEEACKNLWKIRRRNNCGGKNDVGAYHCKWCGCWHIGHQGMQTGFLSRKEKLECN